MNKEFNKKMLSHEKKGKLVMNRYRMVAFSFLLLIILFVPTPIVAQDEADYVSYLYHCDTVPEAAPPGPWVIETLDEGVEVMSDGMLLYLNAYEERGEAIYYRSEPSLADAEYYTMGVNMYVERARGGWINDFGFGASDGQKDVVVMGLLDFGGVFILTNTGPYTAEVDLTVPADYYLVVDRSNIDPLFHTVELYRDHELVIQAPYAELPEYSLEIPTFGFGTVVSDTVWDYINYEVGYLLARTRKVSTKIQALPDDAFRDNPDQKKKALKQKLDEVKTKIEDDSYEEAELKLVNDVRSKMDGNSPDDWITDPAAQEELCELIDKICEYLRTL